ncbi:MAG: hypothetical protein ABIE74_01305 [Pseudomonadota bacterium]
MKKKLVVNGKNLFRIFALVLSLAILPSLVQAKVQVTKEALSDYDLTKVEKIVVLPVTSNGVVLGDLSGTLKTEVNNLLKDLKKKVQEEFLSYSLSSGSTILFQSRIRDKKPSTLFLQLNIDTFKPTGKKKDPSTTERAEVKIKAELLVSKNKKQITEFYSEKTSKKGIFKSKGEEGFDEALFVDAANKVSFDLFKHLAKLTGLKYNNSSEWEIAPAKEDKKSSSVLKEEKKK